MKITVWNEFAHEKIDEAVKARPVQRRKGCAADARKTLHPFGKEDEKIAEEQP